MEEYFSEIVDVNFTAGMEEKLDDVEMKDVEWKQIWHGQDRNLRH